MSDINVRLVNADTLVVGPDEVLIVKVPLDFNDASFAGGTELDGKNPSEYLVEALSEAGLDRVIVLSIEGLELATAKRDHVEKAVSTLAWWLYQAQTGFGKQDAEGIDRILKTGTSERPASTAVKPSGPPENPSNRGG